MKRITIIIIMAILLAKIASGQELFFPDSNIWEMTINEDFNTNNVSLTHYKDHNKAKIEKDTELPALLMDSITFDFGGAQFETLQVINTAGVVVREARLGGQTQHSLPLKGLPAGVYLYRLQNGETATQGKFVVEN